MAQKYSVTDYLTLNGIQKSAILLTSLGLEATQEIFKKLPDRDLERITIEIARIESVEPDVVELVIEEFYQLTQTRLSVLEGGMDFASSILGAARGEDSGDLMRRIEAATETSAFSIFQAADIQQIINFLEQEHPQISAIIMGNIKSDRAAEILSNLREDLRSEIMYRLATMGNTAPEVLEEIEAVIMERMGQEDGRESALQTTGPKAVADILNAANMSTEKMVLDDLTDRDPELADEVKKLMFLFEDISQLEDSVIQRIISEIDKKDLVLALKGSSEDLKNKFSGNMSERARLILGEDMEAIGKVRLSDVEEGRMRIIKVIKNLEDQGIISTARGSTEQMIE
jgi:flagellar motor switch protein FliG